MVICSMVVWYYVSCLLLEMLFVDCCLVCAWCFADGVVGGVWMDVCYKSSDLLGIVFDDCVCVWCYVSVGVGVVLVLC